MPAANQIICLLVLSHCGQLLVSAYLTVKPQNDAVLAGSTVVLNCTADLSTRVVQWYEYASVPGGITSGAKIISSGKTILSHPSADRYSILGGDADFNLQIRDVRVSDGGKYVCQDIHSGIEGNSYVELIVFESDPVCQDSVKGTGVVIEGNSYSSECKIKYKGTFSPVIEWEGPGNFVTNSTTTSEFVWSWIRFTANRNIEGGAFKSLTKFGVVKPDSEIAANNTPDYQYAYAGPNIQVRWGPQNVKVTPIKAKYDIGDVLTCTADSNPEAKFVWTNMRNMAVEPPGATFTITEAIAGYEQGLRCRVEVTIDGCLHSQDTFVNAMVPGNPKNVAVTPVKSHYTVGDVLICSADSNLPVTFVWTNMRTQVAEPPGPNFKITEVLVGSQQAMRCHAEILFDGCLYSEETIVNVRVPVSSWQETRLRGYRA